jgi:hypothetical protein
MLKGKVVSVASETNPIPMQYFVFDDMARPCRGDAWKGCAIRPSVRFDDECRNGHATFAITGTITERGREVADGCIHEEIVLAYPEIAPLVRWHLVSTDGPLHYVANTMYYLGRCGGPGKESPQDLEAARRVACWPDMPEAFLGRGTNLSNARVEAALLERLPTVILEFRAAMESIGFAWVVTP